jgi:dihydroflavonol-4-reductase
MKSNQEDRILVTGASGCLGANLTRDLVNEGKKVSIFILKNTWHPFLDGLDINVIYGDITNEREVEQAIKDCVYVYHVAGIVSYHLKDKQLIYNVNYVGTRNVLTAAKKSGVKKVVVTASTAGIGIPQDKCNHLNESSPFDHKFNSIMYMYSKHLCIKECQKFAKQGLDVSIVSPTTIIGQGDSAMHMGAIIKKIKEEKMKFAPPGGNSFVSVDDAVQAHKLVMEKGQSGENYIFSDEQLTYLEMFNIVAEILGKKKVNRTIPKFTLPLIKLFLRVFEGGCLLFNKKTPLPTAALDFSFKFRYFDSSKARKELGWIPTHSFKEAIGQAIDFYERENLL